MKSFHLVTALAFFGVCTTSAQTPNNNKDKASSSEGLVLTEGLLLSTLQDAREFLEIDSSSGSDISAKVDAIISKSKELETTYAALQERQKSIDTLVRQANAKQLQALVSRMNETLTKETNRKRAITEQNKNMQEATNNPVDMISINEIRKRLKVETIMEESENDIQTWILEIMRDEVKIYQKKLLNEKGGSASECPSVVDVVQDIHMALTKFSQDGNGLVDHAHAAEIVHTLTSGTYKPPPDDSDLVGNSRWRKYIPEDWEQLLPSGWEKWNTAIPSYVYHTLSLKGAKVAPPEAILEPKTLPGSCWPMDTKKGQVTIRLPYPVFIDSITIDHVFGDLVPKDMIQSAPKEIRVFGYPACSNKLEDCYALGFDDTDPMEIARVDYDIEGPTFQNFDTIFATKTDTSVLGNDSEIEDDAGSCSSEKMTSCSSPPKRSFGGVTLKIYDNWGNDEYTCLYRVRVHGEPDIY